MRTKIDQLFEVVEGEDRQRLEILVRKEREALERLDSDSTTEAVDLWKAAKSALSEYVKELWNSYFPEDQVFENAIEVVSFLNEEGWKVSKTKVYNDIKAGRLRRNKEGHFRKQDVLKYAETYLVRYDGGGEDPEKLQELKLKHEIEIMEVKKRMLQMEEEIKRGEYVRRDEFEHALAARASIFKSDLQNFAYKDVPEIVAIVNGDTKKTPDAIQYVLGRIDEILARYVESRVESAEVENA
ncbi:hypothetical protein [Deferribacter abyssi]|uniref:hypothetical protein n=1 Tax=Deferribacter abyssi TaxID=213806 RepID=UPI003C267FC5